MRITPQNNVAPEPNWLSACLLTLGFGAMMLAGCNEPSASIVSVPAFASATNIVFTERTYYLGTNAETHFSVTDPTALLRLVPFTELATKLPCKCAHNHEALFQSPAGDTRVSFCDHCFDVAEGESQGNYEMPKSFYAEFLKLVPQASNSIWEANTPQSK